MDRPATPSTENLIRTGSHYLKLWKASMPTEVDLDESRRVIHLLYDLVRGYIEPTASVRIFGSYATGLGIASSDLDICITHPQLIQLTHRRKITPRQLATAPAHLRSQIELELNIISNMRRHFRAADIPVVFIPSSVPLLKATRESGLLRDFDLTCRVHGVLKAALFRAYHHQFPLLAPLNVAVQQYCAVRGIKNSAHGWSTAHALTLLIINFLRAKGFVRFIDPLDAIGLPHGAVADAAASQRGGTAPTPSATGPSSTSAPTPDPIPPSRRTTSPLHTHAAAHDTRPSVPPPPSSPPPTDSVAAAVLRSGAIDAFVLRPPSDDDFWTPQPDRVTDAAAVDLGALLFGFFDYYGREFDVDHDVVCIRTERPPAKASSGPTAGSLMGVRDPYGPLAARVARVQACGPPVLVPLRPTAVLRGILSSPFDLCAASPPGPCLPYVAQSLQRSKEPCGDASHIPKRSWFCQNSHAHVICYLGGACCRRTRHRSAD